MTVFICFYLLLTEPGFPCNWVSEIVRNIYNELLKLTQRSLSDNEALLTLKFAANAALTFLENMTVSFFHKW